MDSFFSNDITQWYLLRNKYFTHRWSVTNIINGHFFKYHTYAYIISLFVKEVTKYVASKSNDVEGQMIACFNFG